MRLHELIYIRVTYETKIKQQLLEFTTFFHDYMWDGFTEDVGQFVSNEDYEAIEALADKMEHMILNIGCPLSVYDLLVSITQRKIKYWQLNGDHKGKQLKNKADRVRANNEFYYKSDIGKMVIKGHFRWNNRGYMLSRKATDVLGFYINIKF
jgi:hypothetical protein